MKTNGNLMRMRALALVAGIAGAGIQAQAQPSMFDPTITQVATGGDHSCALTASGGVKCWGENAHGALGDGTRISRNRPVDVPGLGSGVVSVAAGIGHTCALTTAGGVKCWGWNLDGQLGDGTLTDRLTPVDVVGLTSGAASIAAGGDHTCVLTAAGGAKCWGENSSGQLGDGTTTRRLAPTDVLGLTSGVLSLSAGEAHTCALTLAGGLKCWGNDAAGQLGDGGGTNSSTAVDVPTLTNGVKKVSAGELHTCALTAQGDVTCWGYNGYGQVGDGTPGYSQPTPVNVLGLTESIADVSAGWTSTCVLTTSGGMKCWGGNDYGNLGDGTTTNQLIPTDVQGLTSGVASISVAATSAHACALLTGGGVLCWGYNGYGQTGNGTTASPVTTPVPVLGLDAIAPALTFETPESLLIGTPLTLTATAVSGLPVSFDSWTPDTCSIVGDTATAISPGLCGVRASQAGNETLPPAPQLLRMLIVPFGTVPDAPAIGTAVAGDAAVAVSFVAPSNDGGSPITGYSAACGSQSASSLVSPIVVNSLTNDVAVTCTVVAKNASGNSAPSDPSNSVTPEAGASLKVSLSVTSLDSGSGVVKIAANPPCSVAPGGTSSCEPSYVPTTTAHLTAAPAPDSVFEGWTGACAGRGSSPTCDLDMTANALVGASFRGPQTLTIQAVSLEQGVGHVYANGPINLQCDGAAGNTTTCTALVKVGETISFSAFPESLSIVSSIEGCTPDQLDSNSGYCYTGLTMTGPKTISATFRGPQTLTLHAVSLEQGVGHVYASGPINLQCDGMAGNTTTCTGLVRVGDTISFSAFPDSLSVVSSIEGCIPDQLDRNSGYCYTGLTMTGPKTISATFRGPQTLTLHAVSLEQGVGHVYANGPINLQCDGMAGNTTTCTGLVRVGDTISFSAFPDSLSVVSSIEGCIPDQLDRNSGYCYTGLTMTGPKTISATFRGPQTLSVSFGGDGSGLVSVGPAGSCVSGPATCSYPLRVGTVQLIVANASPDSLFQSWTGGCVGQGATCSLTVTAPATAHAVFVLRNHPPTAYAGGPYSGVRGQPIAVSGAASSDPDSNPLTYTWDFGDGSATGSGVAPTHAYATIGTFAITLTVNDGTVNSTPATSTVTISNRAPTASAGGPYSGVRNAPITLTGAGSTDPDNDSLTYAWTFGDGSTGSGVSPTHSYATTGTFTVTLTVNDGTASSAPAGSAVTIGNQAPTASAGGPYSGVRNTPVTFSGTGSSDPDHDTLTYSWTFGDGGIGSGVAPTHSYATTGTFTVTLTVSDGTANSAAATGSVTISNQAPTANAGGPYSGIRNGAISFNGAGSHDADNDALTYSWDFGDGSAADTGVAPTHAYAVAGTFTVMLTVNDGTVSSAPATSTVAISNQSPIANAGGPYTGLRNTAITFSGAASHDPDNDALTYSWDFGDGTALGTGMAPTHAYASAGTFMVTITVNDGTANSTPASAAVTITNRAPTANAGGPYAGVRNQAIAFSGAASNDPDNDALAYAWTFGDGATGAGVSPTHAYATMGAFTVTLTVNDGTTNSATVNSTVTITNQAPTASAGGPYPGVRNQAIAFNGTASSDPDNDALTYAWTFGDGGTGTGASPTHAYTTTGTFTATVAVNDGTVTSVPSTATVTISNQAPLANAGGPYSGHRYSPITFSSTGSSDPDNDPLTYAWSFGDGGTATGPSPMHTYAGAGTFSVTLTVQDDHGRGAFANSTVTISNQPPTANAGGPYSGGRNTAIIFNGSGSADPDNDPLLYSWNFGDGSATGVGVAPSHAYTTNGTFTVTLTVNDGVAIAPPVTTTVTISNRPPIANASGPYSGYKNSPVSFTAAGSSDPDGDPLTYAWDFGDGSTGTGVHPTHAYGSTGTFTVTLTVSDSATSTSVSTTATIPDRKPNAIIITQSSGFRGASHAFDGSQSFDPEGQPLTYRWDFGDGATATTISPSHVFTSYGVFNVTLVVNDGVLDSTQGAYAVSINNRPPTADAGTPRSGDKNHPLNFNGVSSNDLDGDPLSYSWNFGDGSFGTGPAPTHQYAALGTYTVTLVVNDGLADSAPSTTTATVANRAPVARPGGPYSGTRLAPVAFNGSLSVDLDGDPITYAWDFGDGGTGTGMSPSHLYTSVGTFTVTLVVNDGLTNSAPYTTTAQITNVAPTVSVTSPGTASIFQAPANVTIVAAASDPDGSVAKVAFFAGSSKIGEALSAPWVITWPIATPGSYSLTAVVTDSSGASVASAPVSVFVNSPPTVALTAPANNTQFAAPATITLTASASDLEGGLTQVRFFQGATEVGAAFSSPYSATWSGVAAGSYTITAVAYDNRGGVTSSTPITVKVTATLTPAADSYVKAQNGNSNFGTDATLTVQQGTSNSSLRWTYMKLDLSGVPAITNAKLRVFGAVTATTSTVIQTAVYSVSDTTWTETGLTWNNKPASGANAIATATIVNNSTTARWYEFDVTGYLQSEKAAGRNVVTLAFRNLANSTPYVSFTSKEGTAVNRPQVVVVP